MSHQGVRAGVCVCVPPAAPVGDYSCCWLGDEVPRRRTVAGSDKLEASRGRALGGPVTALERAGATQPSLSQHAYVTLPAIRQRDKEMSSFMQFARQGTCRMFAATAHRRLGIVRKTR